jgi:quinol monooxygenase YgiN
MTGRNGIEFYPLVRFQPSDGVWKADAATRAETIRWPAAGAVRILIQMTSDPSSDPAGSIATSVATRAELGCEEFEFFRSIEFPENLALVESWSSPEIYDVHWMARLVEQRANPRQRAAPLERRYGENGFEWYSQCRYGASSGIWQPEAAERRMSTVWW